MPEITCTNCGRTNNFSANGAHSLECVLCFETIELDAIPAISTGTCNISGLRLLYQKDQRSILVSASGKTLLGREHSGAELLSGILFEGRQVISRLHCSVEFRENNFYLLDEGSSNGTFFGPNKISCKDGAQLIENGDILFLGREPFVARIEVKPAAAQPIQTTTSPTLQPGSSISGYRCNDSNCIPPYETKELPASKVCPRCGNYNRFVAF